MGVAESDQPTWLRLAIDDWVSTGTPGALTDVVTTALAAAHPKSRIAQPGTYFDLHGRLTNQHPYTPQQASILLSYVEQIEKLAAAGSMTASQIAKILRAQERRLPIVWRPIQLVCHSLGFLHDLDIAALEKLFAADQANEQRLFADLELEDCAAVIAHKANQLGYPGDLSTALRTLYSAASDAHVPYLQMLHLQCSVCEFFDNSPVEAYEFNPRGGTATWVFGQYPDHMVSAGNPVLNNAKAVERLDYNWASSKRGATKPQAFALVEILSGLDTMGFAPRQELAGSIRLWLQRIIRLSDPDVSAVPDELTPQQAESVLRGLGQEPSVTAGILEQRIVDAIAATNHATEDDWRARGLGDSVNASNTSRKKLGDCDFQDVVHRRAIAYEAHGGTLTAVYLDEHLRTLAKAINSRKAEWEGVAEISEWELELVFVAHGFDCEPPKPQTIDGVKVSFRFESFEDFLAVEVDETIYSTIAEHVNSRLNERRTPNSVRKKYCSLIDG